MMLHLRYYTYLRHTLFVNLHLLGSNIQPNT